MSLTSKARYVQQGCDSWNPILLEMDLHESHMPFTSQRYTSTQDLIPSQIYLAKF